MMKMMRLVLHWDKGRLLRHLKGVFINLNLFIYLFIYFMIIKVQMNSSYLTLTTFYLPLLILQ